MLKAANGEPSRLFLAPDQLTADSWSPDGRFIFFDQEEPSGKSGIWQLPLEGDHKPAAILRGDFQLRSARVSPDGRWLVYVSNETGREEVYVQDLPGPGGKWVISNAGGTEPRWRADGRELFFLAADSTLMSVQVEVAGQALRASVPHPLFHTGSAHSYVASRDGQRFLVAMPLEDDERASIAVVLNWTQDLRRQ